MSEKQKKRLEDLLLDDSFVRYIKNLATEKERRYWQDWQRKHPDHQVLIKHAKELIQFTGSDERRVQDPHIELKKFEEILRRTSTFPKKPGGNNLFRVRKRTGSFWLSAAAALVFVIITAGIFMQMEKERGPEQHEEIVTETKSEYQTGFGEKAFLHLSDGSRIVLNANSHLTYFRTGSDDNKQNIDVHLKGEAWFQIEPLAGQSPRIFRVHTSDAVVEVTGTTFAVQKTSEGTRTVLEKGEVRVSTPNPDDTALANKVILKPGEMAELIPGSDRIELQKVNPEVYTSWIRDNWVFEQTPLKQIAERIESVFGVKVNISSPELQEKTLSGTISSSNLQLIKEGLSEALQEQVRQNGDTIIIGPE